MSFSLVAVSDAIADTLGQIAGVQVWPSPPTTLNPPAYVVSDPTAEFGQVALGLDESSFPIKCAVGLTGDPRAELDKLIAEARAAIGADRTLGGQVSRATCTELRSIRTDKVAGIDVLVGELTVVVDS